MLDSSLNEEVKVGVIVLNYKYVRIIKKTTVVVVVQMIN